ncbi:succinate-semialdehyde dehydrogenase [Syncephalis pseudoplumigaleata]|uniref:Succinate-semialdehyde dehydrogenase n=1 Tax=Syncephalis pseudoplumigaleata TaxID=1712513 RepID=A0A4P9Z0W7_9FUNG|nr:succinate-semialdehyde dehydrogenase [Syncephalis pseudoplumigaleata]|eukprot:RKP25948.1 succinate-semialdehyde dehydrogenase [Syncephalis pseudoplumigaleata]
MQLKDASLFRSSAFIDGGWVDAKSNETLHVVDPSTGKSIGTVPDMDVDDVKDAVEAAHRGYDVWKTKTCQERHDILLKWYRLMIEHEEDLAAIMTLENGKAVDEIRYGRSFIQWFAEEARRIYGDVIPSPLHNNRFLVVRQPVGVCSILTPWNFPSAMITRKAGPALAVGCSVVIKPAAETPFSALALCELANRAGIPKGVINVVTTDKHVKEVGYEMCTNPIVRKVSFTGSTAVGKLIMKQCASGMKKVSLELGGNAPFIVFDDADVDTAVQGLLGAKLKGSGQVCIAPNRIYVQEGIHDAFTAQLAERMKKLRIGSGFDEKVTTGPLISERAREKVNKHVEDAVARGARVLLDGRKELEKSEQKESGGYFFHPTLLTDLHDEALISSEETFGPLLAVRKFTSEQEVVELANRTEYGLAAYVYTRDVSRVFHVSEALESGMVGVNSITLGIDATPFGGVKESGMGREGSKYGVEDYVNKKLISIGLQPKQV